jgi:hypothetical protein
MVISLQDMISLCARSATAREHAAGRSQARFIDDRERPSLEIQLVNGNEPPPPFTARRTTFQNRTPKARFHALAQLVEVSPFRPSGLYLFARSSKLKSKKIRTHPSHCLLMNDW